MQKARMSPMIGPLSLSVVFYMKRPKGHYRGGKPTKGLATSAPKHPAIRPDATKLLRSTEDALTSVLWLDDSQIVSQHVYKKFAESTGFVGCSISVRQIPVE
jgi:Holliday junction resolvase RusA-like endonuclease